MPLDRLPRSYLFRTSCISSFSFRTRSSGSATGSSWGAVRPALKLAHGQILLQKPRKRFGTGILQDQKCAISERKAMSFRSTHGVRRSGRASVLEFVMPEGGITVSSTGAAAQVPALPTQSAYLSSAATDAQSLECTNEQTQL